MYIYQKSGNTRLLEDGTQGQVTCPRKMEGFEDDEGECGVT